MPLHIETPLIESPLLGAPGRRVWLKMEALQPPGSFKLRGVGLACEHHARRGARRLVSSSGGNAGLAVAWSGRALGLPVTVVVPQTTPQRALQALRDLGAEVQVHGASWQEAHSAALALITADAALIHPFDDPLLWQGHASLIAEAARQGPKPGAVVLSVGGGGLLAGVVRGLQEQGWHDVPVLAVETEGAASFRAATLAGQTVDIGAITSRATSLGARRVCEQALRCWREHPVHSVLVSDAQAIAASLRFVDQHRVVVEPACGASLAVLAPQGPLHPVLARSHEVLAIVCGGATAGVEMMREWAAEAGVAAPVTSS
ncbi:pyridoxal-phosphate dependent enzyme [Amphibiibacter pelophylacis]|uniref:Pyridoxal-phosphate dependent enzyme n=1 Tax=Amphibiibacter pelophylacis TaxID=1799477 RepID=A0ACC6P2L1_9BURK